MTRIFNVACLILVLVSTGTSYEEKNLRCFPAGHDESTIPSIAVCDGTLDCATGTSESDLAAIDESPDICAPLPYLEKVLLESQGVTSTSAQVSWSTVPKHVPGHELQLAGYFLSGKSMRHSFQNSIPARVTSYQLQWLKPWTNYTVTLRPFYTKSGKRESAFKLGRAASAVFRTDSSEPEMPGLVSVLSSQQRNVVFNIVGPSAWNSDPVGFHIRWEATSERRGPQGEEEIALSAEWSPEENVMNVTLPLQGGMDYRLSVSAVGSTSSGKTLRGPELEVNASVPLESYAVVANSIDSTKALISWRASELVDVFRGNARLQSHTTITFDGKKRVTSKNNVIVTGLSPWAFYIVSLEGCTAGKCHDAVNTSFSTPPQSIPSPTLARIEATGTDSLELAWLFPQSDRRVYDGFLVRYCPANLNPCLLTHTKENNVTLQGFEPSTLISVEIRAQIQATDGRPLLGPPESASVTTWSNVPAAQVGLEASIDDGIGTCLLSWTCTNSSVDYLQFKITDYGMWTTCDDSVDCDATVINGRTVARTRGNLRLTHQKLQDVFPVWIRCCNIYGCGSESSVNVNTYITGPPSLSTVTISPNQRSALLRYDTEGSIISDGVVITWYCNGNKETTYTKTIYWRHQHNIEKKISLEGLLFNAESCEFFASLFRNVGEERYFSLPVQAVEE